MTIEEFKVQTEPYNGVCREPCVCQMSVKCPDCKSKNVEACGEDQPGLFDCFQCGVEFQA